MIITIDGPVASGKSTMARLLAHKLGYYYINSGLLFRSLAYVLVNRYGFTEQQLQEAYDKDLITLIDRHVFEYHYDEQARIFIDGVDSTDQLKQVAIDRAASLVSVHEAVRDKVLHMQHIIAATHSCVVEGRDAGTVVFPHADVHIFLTAPVRVRAARWQKDQLAKGQAVTLEQAIAEITERDERDSSRTCAPLRVPDGAIILDAGNRTASEILTELVCIAKRFEH